MAKRSGGWKIAQGKELDQAAARRSRKGVDYIDPIIPQFATGDNMAVRLVPPLEDDDLADVFGFDLMQHFVEGMGYLLCPATFRKPCPICVAGSKMRALDRDAARAYKQSRRTLVWLIDYSSGNPSDIMIWAPPQGLIERLCRAAKDRRTGKLRSLNDPETAPVIYFDLVNKGAGYSDYDNIQLDPNPEPLDVAVQDQQVAFREILIESTPEMLAEAVALIEELGTKNEGDDVTDVRRSESARRGAQNFNDEELAEEDQAPPRRTRAPVAVEPAVVRPRFVRDKVQEESDVEEEAAPKTESVVERVRARIAANRLKGGG